MFAQKDMFASCFSTDSDKVSSIYVQLVGMSVTRGNNNEKRITFHGRISTASCCQSVTSVQSRQKPSRVGMLNLLKGVMSFANDLWDYFNFYDAESRPLGQSVSYFLYYLLHSSNNVYWIYIFNHLNAGTP